MEMLPITSYRLNQVKGNLEIKNKDLCPKTE